MANSLDTNLRGGDRSEYLAQFFLSALGTAVLVPRPEDQGFDYFCSLQRKNGRRLTFHAPFSVQLGSVKGDTLHKEFVYGGLTEAKIPQHKKWEIDFLRNQQTPFFVGTIDKAQLRFRLYSTSAMWFILHRFDRIGQIELRPDAMHDPIEGACLPDDLMTPDGALPTFSIPLGTPVIDLQIPDLATDKFEKAAEALEYVINIEQRNLVHRSLGVRFSQKLMDNRPNEIPQRLHYSFVPTPELRDTTLDWLRPIIITLAIHYKESLDDAALGKIRGMLELLPLSDEDRRILCDYAGMNLQAQST